MFQNKLCATDWEVEIKALVIPKDPLMSENWRSESCPDDSPKLNHILYSKGSRNHLYTRHRYTHTHQHLKPCQSKSGLTLIRQSAQSSNLMQNTATKNQRKSLPLLTWGTVLSNLLSCVYCMKKDRRNKSNAHLRVQLANFSWIYPWAFPLSFPDTKGGIFKVSAFLDSCKGEDCG